MKRLTIGLLAHVDAGKTTLAENLLFNTNSIRSKGRVDHGDTTLDNYELERLRGITVFTKMGHIQFNNINISIIDTPGHIDFSNEMLRGIDALDYAILVVGGTEKLNQHTVQIFDVLKKKGVPTFVFVNKMDISYLEKDEIISDLKENLSMACVDFSKDCNVEEFYENIASLDEELIEKYFEEKMISDEDILDMIFERKLYPVCFGSALKNIGVDDMLETLEKYTKNVYKYAENQDFCGKVIRIECTNKKERLTYIKITSGILKVKDSIRTGEIVEKVNQIRLYQGAKYELLSEANAGMTVVITGANNLLAGMTVSKSNSLNKSSESLKQKDVFECEWQPQTYQVILDERADIKKIYNIISSINDEMPDLNIVINEYGDIEMDIMGEVQGQIVREIIKDKFNIEVILDKKDYSYIDELENALLEEMQNEDDSDEIYQEDDCKKSQSRYVDKNGVYDLDRELLDIFEKTYGKIKERKSYESSTTKYQKKEKREEPVNKYLLIDGYNVIYAIDFLKDLAMTNFDSARQKLMDMVSNYAGTIDSEVMIVFDAYKVKGNTGSSLRYHNITVIYTKEAETADSYIEKFAHNNGRKFDITVVTSDGVEQIIIRGAGCKLISSREFAVLMEERMQQLREFYETYKEKGKTYLFDSLNLNLQNQLEDVRLGFIEFEDIKDDKNE